MKRTICLLLALLMSAGSLNSAYAQGDRPNRSRMEAMRNALENMPPGVLMERLQERWEEILDDASPAERVRLLQMRQRVETAMRAQGLDPTDPRAWQQVIRSGNLQAMINNAGQPTANPQAVPEDERETKQRRLMIDSGIIDSTTQDAIIEFVRNEERMRQPLLKLARAAAAALSSPTTRNTTPQAASNAAPNGAAPNQSENNQVTSTLAAYQAAIETDQKRHEAALQELDARINYSKLPRLKSFLMLVGIIDNNALAIGGPAAIFAPVEAAPTNQGNPE